MARRFEVHSGSPLGRALEAARAATDPTTMDSHYRDAVGHGYKLSREIGVELAIEHVHALRTAGDSEKALKRCAAYVHEHGKDPRLLLTSAETRLTQGDHTGIDEDLAAIRAAGGGGPLLDRLDGLAAAHHGRFQEAIRFLELSRTAYQAMADEDAVAVLDDDIRGVLARQGRPSVDRPPTSRLTHAEELRMWGRYEEALGEVDHGLGEERDPTRRFAFLEAKARLLLLLQAHDRVDDLLPDLRQAAEASTQPERNLAAVRRFDRSRREPLTFDGFENVRWLILDGQLAAAEDILLSAPPAADPAIWHLAMAELRMTIARIGDTDGDRRARLAALAVDHCEQCLATTESPLVELAARRLLGHAHYVSGAEIDVSIEAWRRAHQLEESVAALQRSEKHRLSMLHAARSEFDELIERAAELAPELVVLAMEAARGNTLVARARELPNPTDRAGAYRWLRRAAGGLPRSQAIWMVHATTDAVHHVFLARTLRGVRIVGHARHEVHRDDVINTVRSLAEQWKHGAARRLPVAHSEFDRLLGNVAHLLGIPDLPALPHHVRRIAVVASGDLAEVPFALLPCPGGSGVIGRSHALSALPSLSLRRELRQRSRKQRGNRRKLLLHGPGGWDGELRPAGTLTGRTLLFGAAATAGELRDALETGRYHQVRLDCHGEFGDNAAKAGLLLADGWLRPDELRAMNLRDTGTLVLGACESGMVQRIGRDENDGFVRAGLVAGASAVLAARWDAHDVASAGIVDRFERHLRCCPRDLALFHAQQGVDGHASVWAAWTVHGASDHPTRNGPNRWIHRLFTVRHRREHKA